MDLTQIRYFLALARTLNFTRAAETCNVTQPALTKSVQRLEEELGGPLLLRERSLTQLTPLGKAMLPWLEQTHMAAERAKEHAAGMRRQTASPLRVGLATDVPTPPFLPLLQELAARLPGFELSLADASSATLCDALLHGTLDVAVVISSTPLPERLNRWPLFTDELVLLMSAGHALAANDAVSLSTLDGSTVICRAADCGMAKLLEQAQRVYGARPAHSHQVDTPNRVADLIRTGFGIAVSTDLNDVPPGLQKRPVTGQRAHDVLLVAVAGRPFTRGADAFIKLARARDWSLSDATKSTQSTLPVGHG